MEILEKRIRATAIQSLLIGVFCVVVALGLLGGGGVVAVGGEVQNGLFLAGCGVAALGLAWVMSVEGRELWPARSSEVYRAFESAPHRVYWVYGKVGRNSGVVVCLDDGAPRTLVANGGQVEAILKLAAERCPGVVLGYGDAQEKRFRERLRAARGGTAA
ncbi:MAG: hypothetical protein H6737_28630 [Alphaproteobacteria bacterium]|nr:hypothetical protein [Alphaproteobacteria bacterium]